MSIALDGISSLTSTQADNAKTSALQDTLSSDLSTASDDELMGVCKEFASYFVEEVLKKVEDSIKIDTDDESSYASQVKDYFKDYAIQDVASEIVDQSGDNYLQSLYEQMKRNYNI